MNGEPAGPCSQVKFLVVMAVLLLGGFWGQVTARTFKVATYNVENLFDLHYSGTEYDAYIPGREYRWDEENYRRKLRNVAEVISDMGADIVTLQEVESRDALEDLQREVRLWGENYPYLGIAPQSETAVRCAVMSRMPIKRIRSIKVPGYGTRDILEVTVDIDGEACLLFINHWPSKTHSESRRLLYAQVLRGELDKLESDVDFIALGDFNSDLDEWRNLGHQPELNDTGGVAGINQILGTVHHSRLITEDMVKSVPSGEFLYNLWLEIDPDDRWSCKFYRNKDSLDHIIVSGSLYDERGISYVDDSFHKFDPDYLFDGGKLFRWQRADKGEGVHLGRGYSDHLPLVAEFSTLPFSAANATEETLVADGGRVRLSRLYSFPTGKADVRVENCVVIYKFGKKTIIKQEGGRAILIYGSDAGLHYGCAYDMRVKELKDYHGLREITAVSEVTIRRRDIDVEGFYLSTNGLDLSARRYQNEVVREVSGYYRRGYLYYAPRRKIKLYFDQKAFEPANGVFLTLKKVRIGYYEYPEIVVEKSEQIQ
jgi:endonuclease/exonuclease/phosphatase family metal-dependent hydrolase